MIPRESMLSDYTHECPDLLQILCITIFTAESSTELGGGKIQWGDWESRIIKKRPPTQHLSMSVFILMGYLMGGVGGGVSFLPYT